MGTKITRQLPARLDGLRQRFERWRRTRKGRERISGLLRAAAVKLADRYGIHRTSKVLRVHLKGFGAPDLTALSLSFWQSE